ncbi:MAG: hypothetical protein KGI56_02130 [Acidobacteriota bacterium]|nr:hypothetical protein [Acidobacteriota bacterium]
MQRMLSFFLAPATALAQQWRSTFSRTVSTYDRGTELLPMGVGYAL